ncbi:MAG: carbohydrate ABC transporter permease [Oscillospiraceae bacterium]|jgi:putative aldouronate transport system permease protein|nr:carbohydrate ABC transporter permease [Oscillospiraceae bacterium]
MIEKKAAAYYLVECLKYVVMILFALTTLLPFVNLIAKSFSGEAPVISGRVTFWPLSPTLETYRWVLKGSSFFNALRVSGIITVFGSLAAVIVTAMTAYPLSHAGFRGRRGALYLWVFIMLFNGGMVPNYMLYRTLGMMDTLFSLILPGLVNVYNMFLIKNYFETLPESLEEAARIDGASNLRALFQIILPVSLPMLATITLFYAVAYWNDYFTARLYISTLSRRPLQLYLYDMINNALRIMDQGLDANTGAISADEVMNLTPETVRSAAIVLSTLPILMVYPFLQKYFVTGIVVGSVKG